MPLLNRRAARTGTSSARGEELHCVGGAIHLFISRHPSFARELATEIFRSVLKFFVLAEIISDKVPERKRGRLRRENPDLCFCVKGVL